MDKSPPISPITQATQATQATKIVSITHQTFTSLIEIHDYYGLRKATEAISHALLVIQEATKPVHD